MMPMIVAKIALPFRGPNARQVINLVLAAGTSPKALAAG